MTRIIAIVVVIAAAVVAYMYTQAGDVEIGEVPTSTQPAGDEGHQDSIAPDDAAAVTNPAQEEVAETEEVLAEEAAEDVVVEEALEEEVVEAPVVEEVQEELIEEELLEGTLEPEAVDEAVEAEVLDDTAETVPAESGPADEEPDAGIGTVSTEEETDGSGIEGIVAEPGDQQGLAGADPSGTDSEPDSIDIPEEVLDTTNDNAPEALGTGEESTEEAAVAQEATEEAADVIAPVDPGPAVIAPAATPAVEGEADLLLILDPANFDAEAVTAAIDAAAIDDAEKEQLKAALATAEQSPTQLPVVLERIRTALTGE